MLEHAITLLVFFLMFIVGASLKKEDLVQLKKQPFNIVVIGLGQILLLPVIAFLLIIIFKPEPIIQNGLVLVALCPGGAVSNIYTLLARGNVALSVTLTTLNSLLAIFILPLLVVTVFPWLFTSETNSDQLLYIQSKQLILFLLLPVILGMLCRYYAGILLVRVMPFLELIGAIALISLLFSIFFQFQHLIVLHFNHLFLLAISFSVLSIASAFMLATYLKLDNRDKIAVIIEYPVRNLALTALLAISIFKNGEYLLFAAIFFVVQTPIVLTVMFIFRSKNSIKTVPCKT